MELPSFDELRELSERDPEAFEILRADLIDNCIRHSSERNQRRLRGLQFVIEARRRIARSPMAALLDLQAMMYDSLLGLQHALLFQQPTCTPVATKSERVLPFRPPRTRLD
ncbi:DUF3135 domain-containing protein [Marinobacter mangrovi]|uniref:DUF3135 domain-containing protein n=1 Tax=Marinobacter mangrovi TaxID=2803918 RepID=UPI001932627B|nr:DUF3135 domain-containing protein [Marinobacter mangrovi]